MKSGNEHGAPSVVDDDVRPLDIRPENEMPVAQPENLLREMPPLPRSGRRLESPIPRKVDRLPTGLFHDEAPLPSDLGFTIGSEIGAPGAPIRVGARGRAPGFRGGYDALDASLEDGLRFDVHTRDHGVTRIGLGHDDRPRAEAPDAATVPLEGLDVDRTDDGSRFSRWHRTMLPARYNAPMRIALLALALALVPCDLAMEHPGNPKAGNSYSFVVNSSSVPVKVIVTAGGDAVLETTVNDKSSTVKVDLPESHRGKTLEVVAENPDGCVVTWTETVQ